jgi:hypothetical protein
LHQRKFVNSERREKNVKENMKGREDRGRKKKEEKRRTELYCRDWYSL